MIIDIVEENIKHISEDNIAVSFSGGVDSTLLAILAKKYKHVRLYTINFQEKGEDLKYARKGAQALNLELVEVIISKEELKQNFSLALKLARNNIVKAHVLAPLIKLVKQVKEPAILFGAGTEEIFMGYDRHYKFPRDQLKARLKEEYEALAQNEIQALTHLAHMYGKKAYFPYYDDRLLEYVHSFDEDIIAKDTERKKYLLRQAAKGIVPEFIRTRRKKALQYGTKVVEVFRSKKF